MKKESILCDSCGEELIKDTMYPHEFALELKVIDTNRSTSSEVYCVHREPVFRGTKHFCDYHCLSEFIGKTK